MTSYIIISSAIALYLLFRLWYYGLGRKASPELIQKTLTTMKQNGVDEARCEHMRKLLENDDGKDLVMVNLMVVKQPRQESLAKLQQYSKSFMSGVIKRAGHPVALAKAATGNIETLNTSESDQWGSAFLVRYRSRSDMAVIVLETFGSPLHHLKLESLDRTFAFPAAPWYVVGGIKAVVPLTIALIASLLHILLV
ncbi:MAG: hypothetical protein NZ738_09310 [Oceanospirillaceae bacterium]|nr:hypothetical protein [Oceanospirillaceae bacterium]